MNEACSIIYGRCCGISEPHMIRAKGGKRQPRYFYLKDAGANKLVKFMSKTDKKEPEQKKSKIDEVCEVLLLTTKQIDLFIAATKEKLAEIKRLREKL